VKLNTLQSQVPATQNRHAFVFRHGKQSKKIRGVCLEQKSSGKN